MAATKSLIKDSVIYGGSKILEKMVSWLLTTLFTYTLTKSEFGMMTNLYAYAAIFNVILIFGMETGFFRFINQTDKYNPATVYSTSLITIGSFILFFLVIFQCFFHPLSSFIWKKEIPAICIRLFIFIIALDTVIAIPFAYLRYKKRPVKFGFLMILNIVLFTFFCFFFLIICPRIHESHPTLIAWFWRDNFRLEYVCIANLLATLVQAICLISELTGFKYKWDSGLAKKMLGYSFPLVIMGLAGISNQVVDKLIFPYIYSNNKMAFDELGIYSACFKIAMIMIMFTQAFRYAYDPFVFEKSKEKDAQQSYAQVMKYFTICGLLVFLLVTFYLDIIKYMINPEYFAGLPVVPIVLMGELFFAIYFNLSIWYKLKDKTHWGAIFSLIAFILTILINILFIPRYGYMACAWATFISNGLIMLLSYFIGQKKYPIRYDLKDIALYAFLAIGLYAISFFVPIENQYIHMGFNTFLLAIYLFVFIKRDLPLKEIPYLNKWIKS